MGTEPTEPEPWGDMADRRDTTLAARAVRERWPVPADKLPAIMARLVTIATEGQKDKEAVAAARAVISATQVNQADERLGLDREKFEHQKSKDAREASAADTRPIDPAVAAAAIKAGLEAAGKLPPDDASEPY